MGVVANLMPCVVLVVGLGGYALWIMGDSGCSVLMMVSHLWDNLWQLFWSCGQQFTPVPCGLLITSTCV